METISYAKLIKASKDHKCMFCCTTINKGTICDSVEIFKEVKFIDKLTFVLNHYNIIPTP